MTIIFEKNWQNEVPTPGIEPGPPTWKAGILTTRPYGKHDKGGFVLFYYRLLKLTLINITIMLFAILNVTLVALAYNNILTWIYKPS